MKSILTLTVLIGGLTGALAQGTLQFAADINGASEVPATGSVLAGSGTFTLADNSLDFSILIEPAFTPSDAGIYDPAGAGQTAAMIFDLGSPLTEAPGPGGFPGSVSYTGTFTLTSQQTADLENGLWYVNILTSAYPSGEIRGQITPVPEPSALALLGLGAGLTRWFKRGKS